eukprot:TRINITY_DN21988_c0_g1_i1.p1 TRINITY_DN21988_c0_g1~~TRINITY_DN21988_c0_g1_i1.p1  ORF type:complete len:419 (-),score=51.52 TRINITY_DN21988_c0_g1_i1:241-1497(-)
MATPHIKGYTLYQELGSGACGTVYRAAKANDDMSPSSAPEECAIKVYRGGRATEQFQHEREFLRAVRSHPNVVELIASCEGTLNALVMPLYRGLALDTLVRQRNGLSEAAAASVTKDILAATQHVHQCGVLHRDIKPENILISDGRAVLADFDCACYISQGKDPELRQAGTPGYFSPEMVLRASIGTPTDLFSVGCTLFFMFKKKPPFRTTPFSLTAICKKTAICRFQFDVCFDDVSAACKSLISALIVRSPPQRLSSQQALQHEWLTSTAITGQPLIQTSADATVEVTESLRHHLASVAEPCLEESPKPSRDVEAQQLEDPQPTPALAAEARKLGPRRPDGGPAGPARPFCNKYVADMLAQRSSATLLAASLEADPQRPIGRPVGPPRTFYHRLISDKLADTSVADVDALRWMRENW